LPLFLFQMKMIKKAKPRRHTRELIPPAITSDVSLPVVLLGLPPPPPSDLVRVAIDIVGAADSRSRTVADAVCAGDLTKLGDAQNGWLASHVVDGSNGWLAVHVVDGSNGWLAVHVVDGANGRLAVQDLDGLNGRDDTADATNSCVVPQTGDRKNKLESGAVGVGFSEAAATLSGLAVRTDVANGPMC
jgi:hypothetical protein